MEPTPVQKIELLPGRHCHIKRDDLAHPVFGGNKGRKFRFLLQNPPDIDTIVSYGSLHSNAMAALALIARQKGWRFRYYARLDRRSLEVPRGNLALALGWGMELRKMDELELHDRNRLFESIRSGSTLLIPEGGRCREAESGLRELAEEIATAAKRYGIKRLFLPSGTGTTALFLQKHLDLPLYTVACVGGSGYLKEQFFALEPDPSLHPTILEPPRRYHFGRLYEELYRLWRMVYESCGVVLDLLYDPVGVATLLWHDLLDGELLYLHQGGAVGNATMIARYKAKFATMGQSL